MKEPLICKIVSNVIDSPLREAAPKQFVVAAQTEGEQLPLDLVGHM
jgi:hypothetical protein